MKKLLILFIVLTLNTLAYAASGRSNRKICEDMVRSQQSGKSFDAFKTENKDLIIEEKSPILFAAFSRIQADLDLSKAPVDACVSALSANKVAAPVEPDPGDAKTRQETSDMFASKIAYDAADVGLKDGLPPHCPAVSNKPEELCNEPTIPALIFIQSPSYTHLKALSDWDKYKSAPTRLSDKDCDCLIKKMDDRYKTKGPEFEIEIKQADEKLKKLVIQAAGKKLLNQYAANYEDVSFYLNNKANVFTGANRFSPKSVNYDLFCNDPKELLATVAKACKATGISVTDVGIRLDAIIGSLGHDFKGKNIYENFKMLGSEISTLKVDSKDLKAGAPSEFTREKFDEMRNGLSQSEDEVPFVNYLTTAMVKNEIFNKELQIAIEKNVPPYLAIQAILENPANKASIEIMMNGLAATHPNMKDFIKLQNEETTKITFDKALNLNPGLKILLNDKLLFLEMKEVARGKDNKQSILQAMETEKKALTNHFINKCTEFRNHLAITACTPSDEILDQVTRKDMDGIIANLAPRPAVEVLELLDFNVCAAKPIPDRDPDSPFDGLMLSDPYGFSDYYDRKTHSFDKQTNAFTTAYKKLTDKNSQAINKYVAGVTKQFAETRVVAGMSFERDSAGKMIQRSLASSKNSLSFDDNSSQINEKVVEGSRIEELGEAIANTVSNVQPSNQKNSNQPVPNNNAFAGSTLNDVQNQNATQSVNDMSNEQSVAGSREKIKEILAPQANVKNEKLLSNITDKDAASLLRLREQAVKDQQEITDLKMNAEKKLTDDLRQKYEDLEKKYEASLKHRSERQNSSVNSHDPSFSTSSLKGENALQGDGNTSQSTVGSFGSANLNTTTGRNLAVSDNRGTQNVIGDKPGSNNGIIVEESLASATGKSVALYADEEIYSYFDKKEQSIGSLEQIKVTGVPYRAKIVDKNGVVGFEDRVIPYAKLSPKVRDLLARKLLAQVKRAYSVQALKYELMAMDRFARNKAK